MAERIIEKLKKLIAHEESARSIGNLEEAKAFAEKVQELLDSYNLSLSDIDFQNAQSSINESSDGAHAINQWQKIFIQNIAKINGCRVVFSNTEINLVGNELDRLIVFEIYKYFEKLAREFADSALKEFKQTAEYKRKRKKIYHSKNFKTSFLFGFISALITRFRERHEESLKTASNSQALIFIGNKLVEADRWIEKNIQLKKSTGKPKKIQFSRFKLDAFAKGIKAGESVALTTRTVEKTSCSF